MESYGFVWKSHMDCQIIDDQEQFLSFQSKWHQVETIITAVGDFNDILNRDEKPGSNSPDSRSMENFSSMIIACGVKEVNCLFGFFYKLKRLESTLRLWNKEVFGNIFDGIQKAENEALDKERLYDTLQSPEARVENEDEIQKSAVDYFQKILTKEDTKDDTEIFESIPNIISSNDNRSLNALPSVEKVKEVVFSLDKDSAVGPDEFSGIFYQFCWVVIQSDSYEAIVDFFNGKIVPTWVAATSITLIPKKQNAEGWKDYRPISLCNVLNKILTKILASRLNKLLPNIIFPS
ncbi:Reverse transcriptase domain-containing protein [Abeliophyllum distichum]|uniref:Reverse transcriptase domain-containing protein n=1 Tax=Abeliophyllum distichum TaxID=126358 RepID=A0ABD1UML4_9LAMI